MTALVTARIVGRTLLNLVAVLVVLVLLWLVLIQTVDQNPSFKITRTPTDVWHYLVSGPTAGANRAALWPLLAQTLKDAGIGFVVGLAAAVLVATGMVLSKGVEAGVMPVAMVLRSIPLVALAPILTLMFGNGVAIAAVMAAIVVLFPALVNIAFGLRSVSPQMADIVTVYGGSRWTALRRVAYPSALPSFFAALRISVPGAMTGALLAEDLATGKGLGKQVALDAVQGAYDKVWSEVVAITVVSVVLYMLAQFLERLVMARFGMSDRS